jgi:hypothetical protein
MKLRFKVGDVVAHKDNFNKQVTVTAVQEVECFEYQLDGKAYWWSAVAIEYNFELAAITDSPLMKALS